MNRNWVVPVAAALVLLMLPLGLSPYLQETVVKIGVYLLMAVILVWRPEGLMKRAY